MYREYEISITAFALGILRAIPKTLICDIQQIVIAEEKTRTVIHKIQRANLSGNSQILQDST